MPYIYFSLAAILVVIYAFNEQRFTPLTRFLFKMVNSANFIILALLAYSFNDDIDQSFYTHVIIALSLGFIGDLFLGLRHLSLKNKKLYFKIGCLSFMIGHLVYLAMLIGEIHYIWYYFVIISIIMVVIMLFIMKWIKINFGPHRFMAYAYLGIITVTLVSALLYMVQQPRISSIIFFIGFCLFYASDVLLSFIYFANLKHQTQTYFRLFNNLCYFSGQLLITISLMYIGV